MKTDTFDKLAVPRSLRTCAALNSDLLIGEAP